MCFFGRLWALCAEQTGQRETFDVVDWRHNETQKGFALFVDGRRGVAISGTNGWDQNGGLRDFQLKEVQVRGGLP